MFCLTLSAISANVLEIRLPITSNYALLMSTPSQMPCNRFRQRFSRMFSKLAWATLRYYFMRFVTHFPVFMGYRMDVGGYFSEF